MIETLPTQLAESIQAATQRLTVQLRTQAEQINKISSELTELQHLHQQTEQGAANQYNEMARIAEFAAEQQALAAKMLDNVLTAVRAMTNSTIPEQVFGILTDEAARWGLRAVAFDVRGKAAWGATAAGFEPALAEKVLRTLIVPLNQDNPFRQVCDTAAPLETSAEALKKNRNVLEKLQPAPHAPVVLLPILSAGAVAAILYADPREKGHPLPVGALKILAEFSGAHIDRLVALSGGSPGEATKDSAGGESILQEVLVDATGETAPAESNGDQPAGVLSSDARPDGGEAGDQARTEPLPSSIGSPVPATPSGFDASQLTEADQKMHKDAKRFAKLLVSEIELYNKAKVADGRKNGDLYLRLKTDIDRSRQTFEKRFGKSLSKQFPYFHEELVRTLAANDSSVLGPEYPGPAE